MKNKFLSVLFLAMVLAKTGFASPVDTTSAERVARNFWNLHCAKEAPELTSPMQCIPLRWDGFYLFQPEEATGFVIVSADDRVQPVLAYSFTNAALRDSIGRETAWWLDGYQQQMDYCRANRIEADEAVATKWNTLLEGTGIPHPLTVVAPMVTTQWDQDAPYNNLCPSRSYWGYTMHAATGCVATAMAQVMRYWRYPQHGYGSHSYYSSAISQRAQDFGTQTVDFSSTTYDWDNMPNRVTTFSSSTEKTAVATLMYHCGVACDMMYGTSYDGGSGAFIHNIPLLSYGHTLNGMIDYFGYSPSANGINRDKYDDSTWLAIVRAEIDTGRPIIYAGGDESSGGHCFVCSGYDEEGNFHFNWGWSGAGDGYYTLSHLAPGIGGTGGGTGTYDFTNGQQILIGIQPHGDSDSLNIIRHYPYTQKFETAAAGWSASTTNSSYSYSWMIYDTTGCDGNYSAFAMAPYSGTTVDELLSPLLITPGQFRLRWSDRAFARGFDETYSVAVDSVTLFEGTVSDTVWSQHEAVFTMNEGDSSRIRFIYNGSRAVRGLFVDNIVIETIGGNADIDAIDSHNGMMVYPNPTNGIVNLQRAAKRVDVLDLGGRTLVSVSNPGTAIDLSSLQAGTYIIRIIEDKNASIQKLVIKH